VGLATKVDVAGLFRALSLQESQPIARNDGKWVVSLSELLVGGIELVVEQVGRAALVEVEKRAISITAYFSELFTIELQRARIIQSAQERCFSNGLCRRRYGLNRGIVCPLCHNLCFQ
jgi:hypothetical protein